ncbi:MAG: hypothetical protein OXB84_07080, partial [Halobacteriovoraceae bacterium]|nr:hypothetical protein [Halobacteriovoraceae bacterium]
LGFKFKSLDSARSADIYEIKSDQACFMVYSLIKPHSLNQNRSPAIRHGAQKNKLKKAFIYQYRTIAINPKRKVEYESADLEKGKYYLVKKERESLSTT